ncbi:hypothetical protein A3SI_01546 [Nitritalea halalkaliphila LW7]|uniref:Uncharacterized protein n=1 Tax=Nitritalea halalkaliphila LW7 TaxID=1189621 RepID=I5CA67_9BACT|nr:hypothetical protein [Nitritalea halalkaliphila]EIM78719.1 hypothetical protein A3SI_01546 [Nitritalea halalkaliphila LW7]
MNKNAALGTGFLLILLVGFGLWKRYSANYDLSLTQQELAADWTLYGEWFIGTPAEKRMKQVFERVERQVLGQGDILHTWYAQEPGGKLDTLAVFIGGEKPYAGAEVLAVGQMEALIASVVAERRQLPGPEKVKRLWWILLSKRGFPRQKCLSIASFGRIRWW